MNRRTICTSLTSSAVVAFILGASSIANAQQVPTPLPIPEPVVASQNSPEAVSELRVSTAPRTLDWYKTNGAAAVAQRQTTLTELSANIAKQTKDCGTNAAMTSEVGRTAANLNALNAAIASATDVNAAKTFYRQIFTENRVYALVAPKVGKAIRCDVYLVRNEALTAEAARLQLLIDKAKSDGVNVVVAQLAKDAALATLSTINPIPSQATIVGLVPDRGDKTLLAANTAALKASDAQLDAVVLQQKTANAQLDAVRAALRQDLKADAAQDRINAKLASDAKKATAAAERAAKQAAAKAAREARRVGAPVATLAPAA
jgi:hypothetical protein